MYDTENKLSELMHRATASLESDTTALVERGMQKGLRLRRRRTAAVGLAAASALVLTGGVVVAARSIGPDASSGVAAAGTPATPTLPAPPVRSSSTPTSSPTSAHPLSAKALKTLKDMAQSRGRVSEPKVWGDRTFAAASLIVDDGKGASQLTVLVERRHPVRKCPGPVTEAGYCTKRDEFVVFYRDMEPSATQVGSNYVALHRPDGVVVYLTSYNAREEKDSSASRSRPPFSISQLIGMARSDKWLTAAPTVLTK
jgi:hypothetical protein